MKKIIKPVTGFFVGVLINAWIFYPIDFMSDTISALGYRALMVFICAICSTMFSLIGADL